MGLRGTFVFLLSLALATTALAVDPGVESTLLGNTLKRLQAAQQQQLHVMVPDSFAYAHKYYKRAKDRLDKGKSLKSVEKDIANAKEGITAVENGAAQAKLTLAKGMAAREDALHAKANEVAVEGWKKAENLFYRSASVLEKGNVASAEKRLAKAIDAYRSLELAAIKSNYLNEAASLVVKAKDDNVDDYAPVTINKAETLIRDAAQALNDDRYDTDRPRSLAREAKYEAVHARYLAERAKAVDDDDATVEGLLKENEEYFMQIAGELDIVVDFSNGQDAAAQAIMQAIGHLKGEMRDMDMQIGNKNQQLVLLQGEAAEKKQLAAQIRRQEELKASIQRVSKMFDRSEATVLRQDDTIVLRVIGLAFDSGKSTIDTRNFELLGKVISAINAFPRATIDVEGHTDSFGSDASNLTLSQARSESVRSYLLASMPINPTSIRSFGYGESRPVANNETKEGRSKNRRIDLLIKPVIR